MLFIHENKRDYLSIFFKRSHNYASRLFNFAKNTQLKYLLGQQPAFCCGIIGYIGYQSAESILLNGIQILQNRGYDSCGISTIDPQGNLHTTKFASRGSSSSNCIDILAREAPLRHGNHLIGIGHTRWATHGAKTDINAHPHTDYKNRLSLVHNGTIDNYVFLKKKLIAANIPFKSETDTEVIANLISWHLDQGTDIETAVQIACNELEGTWGLAVLYKDCPDRIIVARNGSPLLLGVTEHEVFLASEVAALANYTNHYFALLDGETSVVKINNFHHLKIQDKPLLIDTELVISSPAPYDHWTVREIYEQPESVLRAINHGGRLLCESNKVKLGGLDLSEKMLLRVHNLIITGSGTSLYAAMYGERLMKKLRCFDMVLSVDASEFDVDYIPRHSGGLLLLSQSGETRDVIQAYKLGEQNNLKAFSVVNVVGSLLARLTSCGVYLNAGREVAVASTKAFTSQVTVLALVAVWFAQHRSAFSARQSEILNCTQRLSESIRIVLQCHPQIKELAAKICHQRSLFILGKGLSYCAALEGALKIKEISYIHAEGFPGGSLKHGPFALINENERTPVILFFLSDEHINAMRNAAEQVRARGAYVIGIMDVQDESLEKIVDWKIIIPSLGPLTALLGVIVLQLLAYELAIQKGIDPDKPRGLAKTVTVM